MKMKTYSDIKNNNIKKYIRKEIKPLECTLYVQMKPFWKLFRLLGLLPYEEVKETGDITFCWLSTSMLYSTAIIAAVGTISVLIITKRLNSIKSMKQPDFDRQMLYILSMMVPSSIFFTPVTFWASTKYFVEHIQDFAKFETDYYRVLKNKLNVRIRKCCSYVLAIILIYTASATTIFYLFEKGVIWFHQLAYFHILTFFYMQIPYCGFLSHILINASEDIQKKLSKDALIKYDTSSVFREYRLLWFKLRNISRNIFSVFVRVVILIAAFTTAGLTFCAYTSVSIFRNRGFHTTTGILVITLTAMLLMVHFIVYRSEMLCNSIGKNFVCNFFKNRRNLNCYKKDAISEMRIFIKMLKGMDVKMSNGGYFSINQSSFISLMSLITTNIFIIVQFRNFQPKSNLDGDEADWTNLF